MCDGLLKHISLSLSLWVLTSRLIQFMWFPPVVELSPFSCSTQLNISQAGSLRDHSACQGCCSYLSLPVKTQVLAPLHPARPVGRVRSNYSMQVLCVCVCDSGHSSRCVFVRACPWLCVGLYLLAAGGSVSRCSSSELGLTAGNALG